jgi:pyruvate,orthophosphate dikinase
VSSPPIVDFHPQDAARFGPKLVALEALARLDVPVPPFFAVDAQTCELARTGELPIAAKQAIAGAIAQLEAQTGLGFGRAEAPLLVSVRPSTRLSMPAVLSKVLDVGLNAQTARGLVSGARSRRFALDCRLHLLRTFGEASMPRPQAAQTSPFSTACADARRRFGASTTGELDVPVLEELLQTFHALYAQAGVALPPEDPWAQLYASITLVCRSWRSPAAEAYRRAQHIPEHPGPALAITAMVYGNADSRSASGVALSRHPGTGARGPSGEYLPTAQGDELSAGHGRPAPLAADDASTPADRASSLEVRLPEAYATLSRAVSRIEYHLGGAAEVEFVVEEGRPWVLHAQPAQLSIGARVRAMVELATEGVVSEQAAVRAVRPADLAAITRPSLGPPSAATTVLAKGLGASPGAVTGRLTLSPIDAVQRAGRGESVVLVVVDTTPADGAAVRAAKALVTLRGGTTSDAAIMARALGRPCVVSARDVQIDLARKQLVARDHVVKDGDPITVDGTRGELLAGRRSAALPEISMEATRLLGWADAARRIDVRAVVESADEVREAAAQGAHGFLAHRLGRWMRAELTEVLAAAASKPVTLRLPTAADPDMDGVRLNAVIEATRGTTGAGLEILVDGLAWNLHPRLLKLRARLGEAGLSAARVGVWIDTEIDLKSLTGPASPLAAVDVVIVELDAMSRRSALPRPSSSLGVGVPSLSPADEGPRRVDPAHPVARLLPVVEAARALGAKAPIVGAVAVLGTTDVELGPYIEARLGFLGVALREIELARLAAGR